MVEGWVGSLLDPILANRNLSDPEKMLAILSDRRFGNPKNKSNIDPSALQELISSRRNEQKPLIFVVPAFPFKDPNPFRTATRPRQADLGEVALLTLLHGLALALSQVHPYGVEWIIASDGTEYAPIFYVSVEDAREYLSQLRDLRNQMNYQHTIHIVDLRNIIDRAGPYPLAKQGTAVELCSFEDIKKAIEAELVALWQDCEDESFVTATHDLVNGMKWNMNTRPLLEEHSAEALWSALTVDSTEDSDYIDADLAQRVTTMATRTAQRYAASYLALETLGLPQAVFGGVIRATSHPKQNQVALPRAGSVYPWNGVALRNGKANGEFVVETVPLYSALALGAQPEFLLGSETPYSFRADDLGGS
jgi:hypothetical protein